MSDSTNEVTPKALDETAPDVTTQAAEKNRPKSRQMEKKPRPTNLGQLRYLVDRNDVLSALGITTTMLRDWREAGIFEPTEGERPRQFSRQDVAKLQFIHHLRERVGLPVAKIKALFEPYFDESKKQFPIHRRPPFRFLDLSQNELLNSMEALRLAVEEELTASITQQISTDDCHQWLSRATMTLAASAFTEMRRDSRSVAIYQANRDELLKRIQEIELASRIDESNYVDIYDIDGPSDRSGDDLLPTATTSWRPRIEAGGAAGLVRVVSRPRCQALLREDEMRLIHCARAPPSVRNERAAGLCEPASPGSASRPNDCLGTAVGPVVGIIVACRRWGSDRKVGDG